MYQGYVSSKPFQPFLKCHPHSLDADDISVASVRGSCENENQSSSGERNHQNNKFIEVELKFLTEEEKKARDQSLPVGKFHTSTWTVLNKLKSSICCNCDSTETFNQSDQSKHKDPE